MPRQDARANSFSSRRPLRALMRGRWAAITLAGCLLGTSALPAACAAAAGEANPVVLEATADTYSSVHEPGLAEGAKPLAYAFGGNENVGYLKFSTAGVVTGQQEITKLTLRVFVNTSLTKHPKIIVHPTSSDWTEGELSFGNRPSVPEADLSAFTDAQAGQWMDIPLATQGSLDTNGPTSFALTSSVMGSSFSIATKESGKAPQLIVETAPVSPPIGSSQAGFAPVAGGTSTSLQNLPFDTPASIGSGSGKLVFAHYLPPYPVSLDDQPASDDYYSKNYLLPSGENGKFAAAGGLLRDRPASRPSGAEDYVMKDLRNEVLTARAAGIDGFSVDLMDTSGPNWTRTLNLMRAAHEAAPDFKIMLMPDMSALGNISPDELASALSQLAALPSAHHLGDGRLVVAPFDAEARTPGWWQQVISALSSQHNITTALVPTFIDFPQNPQAWAAIAYGLSTWGGRSPANIYPDYGVTAHSLGKVWMQAVAVQDERPAQGIFDEAAGLAALRKSWQTVAATNADWVQLTTWNDYSETSAFAPSEHHGTAFLEVNAYYLEVFKTGSAPTIRRNAIYVTHRQQFVGAATQYPAATTMKARSNSSAPVDIVEITTFLTATAKVTATIGGQATTWTAPPGVDTHSVPLRIGRVVVTGDTATGGITLTSPFEVLANPYITDLEYVASGSIR